MAVSQEEEGGRKEKGGGEPEKHAEEKKEKEWREESRGDEEGWGARFLDATVRLAFLKVCPCLYY